METVPELLPISELRLRQNAVLARLKDGPVVLTQHSKAAAVLVSVDNWNARAERLRLAELAALHYQRLAEMQSDPTSVVTHAELKRRLAVHAE